MTTYEHPSETKAEFERRCGPVDDETWAALTKSWTQYVVYSGSELGELIRSFRSTRTPKKGNHSRKRRYEARLTSLPMRSLDEDIAGRRARLDVLWHQLTGETERPDIEQIEFLLLGAMAEQLADSKTSPTGCPAENIVRKVQQVSSWWQGFVGEAVVLAVRHRIPVTDAALHLVDQQWPRQRTNALGLSMLEDWPRFMERELLEKLGERHDRTIHLVRFLRNNPRSKFRTWEDLRAAHFRSLPSDREDLGFDSVDALRMFIRRRTLEG